MNTKGNKDLIQRTADNKITKCVAHQGIREVMLSFHLWAQNYSYHFVFKFKGVLYIYLNHNNT